MHLATFSIEVVHCTNPRQVSDLSKLALAFASTLSLVLSERDAACSSQGRAVYLKVDGQTVIFALKTLSRRVVTWVSGKLGCRRVGLALVLCF